MDNPPRSTTRKQRERANVPGGRPAQDTARALGAEENHRDHKGDRGSFRFKDTEGKRSQATLPSQLSGDNDYVRGWLAQTDEDTNQMSTALHLARQRTHSE